MSGFANLTELVQNLPILNSITSDSSIIRQTGTVSAPSKLKHLLESRHDSDALKALKILANMYHEFQPIDIYLTYIIKCLTLSSVNVRILAGYLLVKLAPKYPDTALLSVNTLQKSLSDTDPVKRSLALRTMSELQISATAQIVLHAINRGSKDTSYVVRRTAAFTLAKASQLDSTLHDSLIEILDNLLADKNVMVVGSAVQVLCAYWPERYHLLHQHYHHLLTLILEMDEWAKLAYLNLMLDYARQCFPQNEVSDPDFIQFLDAAQYLLYSTNSSVVIAVMRCFYYLGGENYVVKAVGPVVGLLRRSNDVQYLALKVICQVSHEYPKAFIPFLDQFMIRMDDPCDIQCLKLVILTRLFEHTDEIFCSLILAELEYFCVTKLSTLSVKFAAHCTQALGKCALIERVSDETRKHCTTMLIGILETAKSSSVVNAAIRAVIMLIEQNPSQYLDTMLYLGQNYASFSHTDVKASIVWLLGKYINLNSNIYSTGNTLVKRLRKEFSQEDRRVKLQCLLFAAKSYLQYLINGIESTNVTGEETATDEKINEKHLSVQLYEHISMLAQYDVDYDIQDRARTLKGLLPDISDSSRSGSFLKTKVNIAKSILLAENDQSDERLQNLNIWSRPLKLGSLSMMMCNEFSGNPINPIIVRGYRAVPDWVKPGFQPDSRLRLTSREYSFNDDNDSNCNNLPSGKQYYHRNSEVEFDNSHVRSKASNAVVSLETWLEQDNETSAAHSSILESYDVVEPSGQDEASPYNGDEDFSQSSCSTERDYERASLIP